MGVGTKPRFEEQYISEDFVARLTVGETEAQKGNR